MPENVKPGTTSLETTMESNHYPSEIDNMVRNDTPFEGTPTSMPAESPIGGGGSLPVTNYDKTNTRGV